MNEPIEMTKLNPPEKMLKEIDLAEYVEACANDGMTARLSYLRRQGATVNKKPIGPLPYVQAERKRLREQAAMLFASALARLILDEPDRAATPDAIADQAVRLAEALVKRLES